jgi:hypothetical protein
MTSHRRVELTRNRWRIARSHTASSCERRLTAVHRRRPTQVKRLASSCVHAYRQGTPTNGSLISCLRIKLKITIDWADILRALQVKQSSHTHCQTRHEKYTVGYATTNDPTTNECYNEQFLSIKSGCYNKCGGILYIKQSPCFHISSYCCHKYLNCNAIVIS